MSIPSSSAGQHMSIPSSSGAGAPESYAQHFGVAESAGMAGGSGGGGGGRGWADLEGVSGIDRMVASTTSRCV